MRLWKPLSQGLIAAVTSACCSGAWADQPASFVSIVPQSEDLLLVDGKRFYVENVAVRLLEAQREIYILNIKIAGLQDLDERDLHATYQCDDGPSGELQATTQYDIWGLDKKTCPAALIRICLTATDGKQSVCSPWLRRPSFRPVPREENAKPTGVMQWEVGKPFTWARSDGSLMKTIFEKRDVETAGETPRFFASALVGVIKTESAPLVLGTGQLVYWPSASQKGDVEFTPQRIGGQIRHSKSLSDAKTSAGTPLNLAWSDLTVNYRKNPSGVFDGPHVYGVMMASRYNLLGRTTDRLGGGFAMSFTYPKPFLGIRYAGKVYSYIDALLLPVDLSNDNRGIIFSSKANGMWLLNDRWSVTGDVELRLLNFSLNSENSIVRLQFGVGFAF